MDANAVVATRLSDALAPEQQSSIRMSDLAPASTTSNRLAQIIDGAITGVPRTDPEEVDFSDSSNSRDEGAFSPTTVGLADDDTASDSEDNEEQLEQILNSSDTNTILDALKLNVSPTKEPHIVEEKLLGFIGEVVEERKEAEQIMDEFPLFPNKFQHNHIIDDERVLSTPEKRGRSQLDSDDSEEGSISKRTRSSLHVEEGQDLLSPISKKMQQFQNTKSKIPLPVSYLAVRRSKRLEEPEDTRRRFSPKKIDVPLRSVLKVRSSSLNYIVDSSTGFLHDATKYATEMNALNCEGVPVPQTPNELVTIPIKGERKAAKNPKTALLRGTPHKFTRNKTGSVMGFYSLEEFQNYCADSAIVETSIESSASTTESVSEEITVKKEKKLRWAEQLEW